MQADPSIQFAPLQVNPPPTEPPGWLKSLIEFFEALFGPIGRALGVSWPVLQWVLLGLAALTVVWVGWRVLNPLIQRRRLNIGTDGQYDEATHLLLRRSVEHIAETKPDWVQKASTAREIAAIAGLSDGARSTFSLIATRVERSLFALRRLDAGDWQAAREAYASFALERFAA